MIKAERAERAERVHGIQTEHWLPGWIVAGILLLACLVTGVGVEVYRMDAELQKPPSIQDSE